MPGYRNIGGTWRSFTPWLNTGGTWRRCRMYRNVNGTWKLVAGSHTVSINPSPASSMGAVGQTTVDSPVVAVVVAGAVGALSYQWSVVNGGSGMATRRPLNGNTQQWRGIANGGESMSETWRCTVTDAGTGLSAYADVNVYLDFR